MHYEGIEYAVRASPGLDQWTLLIYFPQKGCDETATVIKFTGVTRGPRPEQPVEESTTGSNGSEKRPAVMNGWPKRTTEADDETCALRCTMRTIALHPTLVRLKPKADPAGAARSFAYSEQRKPGGNITGIGCDL